MALLNRGGRSYFVEPHVSGGIPIASMEGADEPITWYISDILGTTIARVTGDEIEITPLTAFGKQLAAPENLTPEPPISPEHEAPTENQKNQTTE